MTWLMNKKTLTIKLKGYFGTPFFLSRGELWNQSDWLEI